MIEIFLKGRTLPRAREPETRDTDPQRLFDLAMRFYLRELERVGTDSSVGQNYVRVAEEILDRNMFRKGYSRYRFLLDRYTRRDGHDIP